jgi:hypothetical protein
VAIHDGSQLQRPKWRSRSLVGRSSPGEPAFLLRSLNFLFLLVTLLSLPFLHPPALAAASDLVLTLRSMIFSRADRCIDLNDHGQFRGRVMWREAADWPWS